MTRRKSDSNIDWFVFITTAVVIVAVAISLMAAPDRGAAVVDSTFHLITNQFGMVYVWASIATIGFLLWLALGSREDGSTREKMRFLQYWEDWGSQSSRLPAD